VIGLVRETADALGRLTVQHLRLARLEMKSDLRAMGSQAVSLIILAALAMVGYGLGVAGFALLLGGNPRVGSPLLIIGAIHLVTTGIAIAVAIVRLRRVRPMNATAEEMSQTLELGITTATAKAAKAGPPDEEGRP
jgi:ABC-type multidrug transport system permease subunit